MACAWARARCCRCRQVHKAKPGQKVVYGIRPEHFTLRQRARPPRSIVVEPTGPEMHIYADWAARNLRHHAGARVAQRVTRSIELSPRLDKVHLFDAESGKAMA